MPPRLPVGGRPRRQRASAGTTPRTRIRRRTPQMRALRVGLIILAVICGCGLFGVAAVYAAYQGYKSGLPDAQTLAAMEPPLDSRVVDARGNLIGLLHDNGNRHQHVALDQVSRWVKLATVDVEDRHFYENGSWDLPRIVKAGWDDVRHTGATQGASTITEQLAKISFLSPERSLDRKVKELILGIEIENNFSKDQILEMYLNRVSFGNHAIGIEFAAQTYFEKRSRDLDLAELSMLAGLPNSPVYLDPLDHPVGAVGEPNSKERQLVVLQAMVNNGDITQQQADFAYQEPLVFHTAGESEPPVTNFIVYLRQYLDQHFGDAYIKPGGWTIAATLDPKKQAIAEKSVHDGIAEDLQHLQRPRRRAGEHGPDERRGARDGRRLGSEQRRCRPAEHGHPAAAAGVDDQGVHLHHRDRDPEVHDDDADRRRPDPARRRLEQRVLAAQLRPQLPRRVRAEALPRQLVQHPRGEGRGGGGDPDDHRPRDRRRAQLARATRRTGRSRTSSPPPSAVSPTASARWRWPTASAPSPTWACTTTPPRWIRVTDARGKVLYAARRQGPGPPGDPRERRLHHQRDHQQRHQPLLGLRSPR